MTFSSQDYEFMALAIQLAKRGQFTTTPNPNVGCVVVKDEQILAEGWHQKAGTGHAEVNALNQLSLEQTRGATAYVTLEPCSHYGRTPPCADRLVKAEVSRVVIGMLDPNPKVAGNGIRILEDADVKVDVGLLEQDVRALNPGFLSQMERKRPFVQVKLASSLDGKVALSNGESKWITGSKARADVQKHRALSCGVLTTSKTVIRDNAKLNVRGSELNFDYPKQEFAPELRQPLKIILDGSNTITLEKVNELAVFENDSQVLIVKSDKHHLWPEQLSENVKTVCCDYDKTNGFDLTQVLAICSQYNVNQLWVEAGGTLASSFVEQDLYDELIVYMAPKILGKDGLEVLPIGPYSSMQNTVDLSLSETKQVGNDIKFTFKNSN